ncbi:hypothetical protein [Hymenobacter weizhouensis]|uniref:hypothetical protein n=1 Tax=Hymenobacter sp. YIM 151500-1 TaxID=2987689 RepID=UPI0022278134|nr:hypothetical protein [Hymenobacter sp. YIM 151500-1]UYZ63837.1 hypothetical protein OIS53_03100 [Hymenobacter sp. YIM 151500-1]
MADNQQPSTPQDDQQALNTQRGTGQTGQQPIIDAGEGVQMGDARYHLHSAAKGDEDYINGDTGKDDSVQKPEQDKL